nr:reverse transcriptase domain-containing protein [Tanacetum cinerariifolium]
MEKFEIPPHSPPVIVIDPDDQPMWSSTRIIALTPSSAIIQRPISTNFRVKGTYMQMIRNNQFDGFHQLDNETLVEAWLRLKEMLGICYGHGLTKGTIVHIFYLGLDGPTQGILVTRGIFLYNTPNEAFQILEDKVLLKLDFLGVFQISPKTFVSATGNNINSNHAMEVGPRTRPVGPAGEAGGRQGSGEAIDSKVSSWWPAMVGRQGGAAVGEGVRHRGWRPAGWVGGAEDESGGADRRGGGGDEGGGRPIDGGRAGARPWWAGRDAPLVPALWAGPTERRGRRMVRRSRVDEEVVRAGDEVGGRADSWRPTVVGRQGGEAGRLGRGWRGGGGRRVRVVGPGTRPVGPARRHRRGGEEGRRGRPVPTRGGVRVDGGQGRPGTWWGGRRWVVMGRCWGRQETSVEAWPAPPVMGPGREGKASVVAEQGKGIGGSGRG